MDAVFPIAQREGDAYYTLSDFTKLFDQAKSGRYLIGQGYGWHSGIHLTSKMLPWGKGLRPIQAMLDGKIVAFRINPDYLTSTYQEQEFKYSNNFVLIEHEAVNPEDSEDVFKFYTLYMHLAPPSDIGANSSITTRYRLQEARNVRTFKHSDVPTNSGEKKQSMSKGTLLEYLYAEEKETHPYQIDKNTYKMIKCRVVENGKSASGSEKALLNKIVWFASGLNSDFDILEDSSAVLSEPVSEPKWMSDKAAMIRDGSVVSLLPLLFREGIKVSAGEDIGYMGLHEYSNDAIGTKKEDNRVHIEMFSFEEPPEFFKKQISPKNAEENPLVVLDGADSSGAVDMSNSFIQQLLESVTEDQVTDFSSFTARDAKVYLDGKRKHFERFIVKHPTDWHTESSQSLYESIHQTAKEALDIKCSAGFVTIEDYRNSPWRDQVMDSFDLFSQFELERADKFSWMQDLQGDLQLSDDKSLWHYWPFMFKSEKSGCGCILTKDKLKNIAIYASMTNIDNHFQSLIETMSKFEINTCLRVAHFLAQVIHESGSLRYTEEGGVSDTSYGGFKGRGLIQITFESNYKKYSKFEGVDFYSTLQNKKKLASPPYAALSAGWYWSKLASLNSHADLNDFLYITYLVNGGYNGFDDRLRWFNKGLDILYNNCPSKRHVVNEYVFSQSQVYHVTKACFGWGLWHDPSLKKKGCVKNKQFALEGYKRFIDLCGGKLNGSRKWYGFKKSNIVSFVLGRIKELERVGNENY
ncbi:TPA: glycoside hydrolase family 19 protein [Vibrio alginolyticus]|uniref:glycoside hydrolase family 19 protein n=1 Tax=Vibrio TaxID=662 RepID=UPI002022C2DD|nr:MULTISPECIES: hypothetical protein [Vibrio]MCR9515162.1 hypothetical protein [Vibrio alginolyticus]MCS0241823.1 hypothetical protein [Vibrio alginolyticus]MCS0267557.1 hypothetical protein [Vibrio alginolyticus]MDW1461761.1 hypothetical protein [Vibrio sp. YT-16]MDW2021306.1 hypothetical protein [Vibrio sp. 397]